MESANEIINTLSLSIIGGAFVLIFALLGTIWARVEKVLGKVESTKNEILVTIENAMAKVNELMDREKRESIIADKRLNIHDRISSAITDKPFDSKLIATGSGDIPSTSRIQKLMGAERAGNA